MIRILKMRSGKEKWKTKVRRCHCKKCFLILPTKLAAITKFLACPKMDRGNEVATPKKGTKKPSKIHEPNRGMKLQIDPEYTEPLEMIN